MKATTIITLSIEVSDKWGEELRESLNFISTVCRVKLSSVQIEELLTGRLTLPLSDFIIFFQVYTAWYNKSIVQLWVLQDGDEYQYTFENKEYWAVP